MARQGRARQGDSMRYNNTIDAADLDAIRRSSDKAAQALTCLHSRNKELIAKLENENKALERVIEMLARMRSLR